MWAEGWQPEEMRLSQLDDTDIKPIVEWLDKSSERPQWMEVSPCSEATKAYWTQWQSLTLHSGVLYRNSCWIAKQLILLKSLRPKFLRQLHNTPTGHFGITKNPWTPPGCYWVWCHRDGQDWCRNCDLCAENRGPPRKHRSPLGQYNVGSPLEQSTLP